MRAIVLLLGFCVLVVAVSGTYAATEREPTLRLVDAAPVTFRGSEFLAGESVRVALTRQGRRLVRETRANPRGAFDVRFGLVAIELCRGAVTVIASGDRGSRASYRRACRPLHLRPPLRAG